MSTFAWYLVDYSLDAISGNFTFDSRQVTTKCRSSAKDSSDVKWFNLFFTHTFDKGKYKVAGFGSSEGGVVVVFFCLFNVLCITRGG